MIINNFYFFHCNFVILQNIPTVHPASPFDARADADALHKAMKGFGTDEMALIQILCHRTSAQRAAINQAYKSGYGNVYLAFKNQKYSYF